MARDIIHLKIENLNISQNVEVSQLLKTIAILEVENERLKAENEKLRAEMKDKEENVDFMKLDE